MRRVHRGLPPPMRALGDRYVRDEFDRHRAGQTTAAQWHAFHTEWSKCEPGCVPRLSPSFALAADLG